MESIGLCDTALITSCATCTRITRGLIHELLFILNVLDKSREFCSCASRAAQDLRGTEVKIKASEKIWRSVSLQARKTQFLWPRQISVKIP